MTILVNRSWILECRIHKKFKISLAKYTMLPYTFTQEMHPDSLALKGGMTHSVLGERNLLAVSICLLTNFNTVRQ